MGDTIAESVYGALWQFPDLTSTDLRVFEKLLRMPNALQGDIAIAAGCSARQVRKSLIKLVEYHLVGVDTLWRWDKKDRKTKRQNTYFPTVERNDRSSPLEAKRNDCSSPPAEKRAKRNNRSGMILIDDVDLNHVKNILGEMGVEEPTLSSLVYGVKPDLATKWREWLDSGEFPEWIRDPLAWAISKMRAGELPPLQLPLPAGAIDLTPAQKLPTREAQARRAARRPSKADYEDSMWALTRSLDSLGHLGFTSTLLLSAAMPFDKWCKLNPDIRDRATLKEYGGLSHEQIEQALTTLAAQFAHAGVAA